MKNVAQRYNLTTKAAVGLIKKHREELNADGEHAKLVNGAWEVDEAGIRILDGILHYREAQKQIEIAPPPSGSLEAIGMEVTRLSAALESKDKEYKELEEEYMRLQDKFMHLKDDTSAVNEDLIRKYRTKSETLQKQLEQTNADMENLRELKDERIRSLENIVDNLQAKVKELNHSLQKKIDSDLENLSKSAEADRLMERIHDMETEKADMVRSIEKLRLDVSEANVRADDLERVLRGVCSSLDRTKEKISKCLTVKAELTSDAPQQIGEAHATGKSVSKVPGTNARTKSIEEERATEDSSQDAQKNAQYAQLAAHYGQQEDAQSQEQPKEETKDEEEDEKKKKKEKGFLSWLSSRAAALLP